MLRSLAFEGYSARAHNGVLTGKFASMGYLVHEELEELLASFEFEEFGHDQLLSFEGSAGSLKMQVRFVVHYDGPPQEQIWEILATGVLDTQLCLPDSEFAFSDDHPVLHPYTEPIMRLSIRGKPSDPLGTLRALDRMRPDYGSDDFSVDVLAAGYGIFARGPKTRIEQLAQVLKELGVETNPIQTFASREKKPLAILMDRGFVVAERIAARKLV